LTSLYYYRYGEGNEHEIYEGAHVSTYNDTQDLHFGPEQKAYGKLIDVIYGCNHSILAFGDSLTAGFNSEPKLHPYSLKLRLLLQQYYAQHYPKPSDDASTGNGSCWYDMSIITKGVPAEKTTAMISRLPSELRHHVGDHRVVSILGGTNDLLVPPYNPKVVSNLLSLHHKAQGSVAGRKFYMYTIAMTIPPIGYPHINETYRHEINRKLRIYAARCSDHVVLVDLENVFTHSTYWNGINNIVSNRNNTRDDIYWTSDNLHFTIKGYDAVGEMIFNAIKDATIRVWNQFSTADDYICK
jgi:lysophospholipase L1-like esterase